MTVELNHTIVDALDAEGSARWAAELLGLPEPTPFSHFWVVQTTNGVSLDYSEVDQDVTPQHYAFLVGEEQFDRTYAKITERRIEHWSDPGRSRPGELNHNDGGRGVYFTDPEGHLLEIITRPYGSGR